MALSHLCTYRKQIEVVETRAGVGELVSLPRTSGWDEKVLELMEMSHNTANMNKATRLHVLKWL